MEEKILTQHPQGKQGTNISKAKYDQIKAAILQTVQNEGQISFTGLTNRIKAELEGNFEGSIPWYVTTVKLDLEARGLIERVPNVSPQQLRLVERAD